DRGAAGRGRHPLGRGAAGAVVVQTEKGRGSRSRRARSLVRLWVSSEELELHRRGLAALGFQLVFDLGVLIEALQARLLDGGDVDENVRTAALGLDEAIALGRVEPLDRA